MSNICGIDDGWRLSDCDGIGGIKRVYFGNWERLEATFDVAGLKVIEDIVKAIGTGPIEIYEVEQEQEWAGAEGVGVHNRENDTSHVVDNLTIKLSNLTPETNAVVRSYRRSRVFAIVEGQNDQFYFYGLVNPGKASESTTNLGTTFEDMNGSEITFEFKSKDGMYNMDGDLIDDPLKFDIVNSVS